MSARRNKTERAERLLTRSVFFFEKNPKGGQILLWREFIQQGRAAPCCPEESKETGGFVAGDPTGTASPWHTTLLAKSSVLYLCEGMAADGLFCPPGGTKEGGRGL